MGGMFSKPKTVKPPPVPEPAPIPEVAEEVGETAIKRARRKKGYAKTIITGALTPTPTGKRTVLG